MASNGKTSITYTHTVESPRLGNKSGSVEDVEMVTWLQYPLDYTIERGYCSELFGSLSSSSCEKVSKEHDQGVRQLSVEGGEKRAASTRSDQNAEDALALAGAGRASGFVHSQGAEAFNKVKTIMQQTPCLQSSSSPKKGNSHFAAPSSLQQGHHDKHKPYIYHASSRPRELASATVMAENYPAHGAPHTSTSSHLWSSVSSVGVSQSIEPRKEPATAGCKSPSLTKLGLGRGLDIQIPHTQGSGYSLITKDQMKSAPFHAASAGHWELVCTVPSDVGNHVGLASLTNARNMQGTTGNALAEVVPSCSGGSQTSGEMSAKETSSLGKHKLEDCDCQSKNAEVDSAEMILLNKRCFKRSRVAESHNLSEKRRRNRINEKLKTLQELIPNSCKTDKASILHEAIEYLKALQSQLQMMSTRNGMRLPPVVTPAGVHHLQGVQMAPFLPAGIGLPLANGSTDMGTGLGLTNFSQGIDGRPFQAFSAISPHFNLTTMPVASQFVGSQPYPGMELSSCEFLALQQAPAQESFRQSDHGVSHAELSLHGESLSLCRVSKDR